MIFQAYCPYCEKTVSAATLLDGDDLKQHARDSDAVIEVMHLPDGEPDHRWNLMAQEKDHLRKILGWT
jgi:hypothetical protein